MARLIDADKLMQMIPTEEYNARMAITYAPTVDAVEVIRCKDCTMWNKERQICDRFSSTWTAEHTKPNDYCCWGERKGERTVDAERHGHWENYLTEGLR